MSQLGKLWIILNPAAGKGKAAKQYVKIDKFLRNCLKNFEIITTKNPGDALNIARELPLNIDDITVAAGGDGTCNEVVNGLLTRPAGNAPPVFGVLPVGRGNDFASTPGIPVNIDNALEILLNSKTRLMDIGLVKGGFFPQGRYFINGVGIGFDTKVGFEAAKMKIRSGISYAIGALITIARYEPSPVLNIRYDDNEVTLPATIVSVVNGRRMGGSFYMGPDALIDDGLLDICYVRHQKSRIALLKILPHYTKGTQKQCEGVYTGRGLNFHLKAESGTIAAHCDGETICYEGSELEITCIPNALRLLAG
ncbi:MAG: diacylglycerol kinase family lipid kinase [Treponema sp.]|nr:diacylglycerol kinase family lipid kinase [Treponema sp.]